MAGSRKSPDEWFEISEAETHTSKIGRLGKMFHQLPLNLSRFLAQVKKRLHNWSDFRAMQTSPRHNRDEDARPAHFDGCEVGKQSNECANNAGCGNPDSWIRRGHCLRLRKGLRWDDVHRRCPANYQGNYFTLQTHERRPLRRPYSGPL